MILLVGIALGVLIAWALGGDLMRLATVRLRGTGLVFASLGIQAVLFSRFGDGLSGRDVAAAHIASYGLLLLFAALNLRRSGAWLLTAGLACNAVAIIANDGRMPVSLTAWRAAGLPAGAITRLGTDDNNVLIGAHSQLSWLGDRLALPSAIPGASPLSVGDVLIVVGLIGFIYRVCAPMASHHRGLVLAPLRFAGFRRVLAGRLASTFGDWLAMTAVVTWMFDRSHSTAAVSAFMVARIVAAILGSSVSAPMLDRFSGFRVLAFVEATRGLATALMIPLAALPSVWPLAVVVCLSSFLGAATGPSARSLVPDMVPDEHLHQANALHGVARNTTMVAGSLVAAVSVVKFGITTALAIDLLTFVLAAGLYAQFPVARRAPVEDGRPRQTRRSVIRLIASRRTATGLIASFTIATAAIGLLNASLPDLLWTRFGQANAYGYAIAAIGIGLVVGELLSGFIRHDMIVRRSIPIAFIATAVLILLVSASPLIATALLVLGFVGAADGVTEITYDTLLQRDVPAGSRGAAFALGSAIQNGGMILGLAAAAVIDTSTDAARISAVVCAAAVPIAVLGLIRRPAKETAGVAAPPAALAGRLGFVTALDKAIAAGRDSGDALGVLFIDLDGFRHVNDRHGYDAGDQLLEIASRRLHAIAVNCRVARLGVDEFLVSLPPAKTVAEAAEHVRKLCNLVTASLSREYRTGGDTIIVGVSVGAALHPPDGGDAAALIHHAERRMRTAKPGASRVAA